MTRETRKRWERARLLANAGGNLLMYESSQAAIYARCTDRAAQWAFDEHDGLSPHACHIAASLALDGLDVKDLP